MSQRDRVVSIAENVRTGCEVRFDENRGDLIRFSIWRDGKELTTAHRDFTVAELEQYSNDDLAKIIDSLCYRPGTHTGAEFVDPHSL